MPANLLPPPLSQGEGLLQAAAGALRETHTPARLLSCALRAACLREDGAFSWSASSHLLCRTR